MPSLEELIDAEGYYELGSIDGTTYCWMDIVVAVSSDGIVRPLCMKDDWQKTQQFAIIEARREIADLTDTLFALRRELTPLQERANRVAWLESEVARLTRDLQRFREQEAAQRHPDWQPGAFEVQHLRDCDAHNPPICSLTGNMIDPEKGVCQCSWCRKVRTAGAIHEWPATPYFEPTNSHIAPNSPLLRPRQRAGEE